MDIINKNNVLLAAYEKYDFAILDDLPDASKPLRRK